MLANFRRAALAGLCLPALLIATFTLRGAAQQAGSDAAVVRLPTSGEVQGSGQHGRRRELRVPVKGTRYQVPGTEITENRRRGDLLQVMASRTAVTRLTRNPVRCCTESPVPSPRYG